MYNDKFYIFNVFLLQKETRNTISTRAETVRITFFPCLCLCVFRVSVLLPSYITYFATYPKYSPPVPVVNITVENWLTLLKMWKDPLTWTPPRNHCCLVGATLCVLTIGTSVLCGLSHLFMFKALKLLVYYLRLGGRGICGQSLKVISLDLWKHLFLLVLGIIISAKLDHRACLIALLAMGFFIDENWTAASSLLHLLTCRKLDSSTCSVPLNFCCVSGRNLPLEWTLTRITWNAIEKNFK